MTSWRSTGQRERKNQTVARGGLMIASVSENVVVCSCFRILLTTCGEWSAHVRWCPLPSATIVTQLVTRSPVSIARG
jgi:hypothetical protein